MRRALISPYIQQDLLYSLGAFLTVCRIRRNEAERRLAAVLAGQRDPGPVKAAAKPASAAGADSVSDDETSAPINLAQIAEDQILAEIRAHFAGHGLADLVAAILQAEGFSTKVRRPERMAA